MAKLNTHINAMKFLVMNSEKIRRFNADWNILNGNVLFWPHAE